MYRCGQFLPTQLGREGNHLLNNRNPTPRSVLKNRRCRACGSQTPNTKSPSSNPQLAICSIYKTPWSEAILRYLRIWPSEWVEPHSAWRWFVKMEEAVMEGGISWERFSSFFRSELLMGHEVTYLSSLHFNFLTYKKPNHIALLLGYGDPKSSNDALVSVWHMCSHIDFPAGHISLWPFKTFFLLLQNMKCLLLSGINQRTSIQFLLANEKKTHPQHSEEIEVLTGAFK